jgi:hypothetical protein
MGLSSSQARLLNLTSRMHQIEYKAAKLEAEKLQMANESDRVYSEYLDALDKTKIQHKVLTTDGSVTYKDFTSYQEFIDAGFALTIKESDGFTYTVINEGDWSGFLMDDLGLPSDTPFTEEILTNLINSGMVNIIDISDGMKYDDRTNASDYYDKMISVSTSTDLQEVTDESGLKKAEAKYEADMKKIDRKDSKYDSDIAALETERTAISDEMDTLKTVAKDNVERTFKIFS